MASISRRGDAWRAMIRRRGQVLTRTFDTEAQAEAWAGAEEARIVAGATAAHVVKTPSSLTVADLFARYAQEVSPGKGSGRWEAVALRKIALDFPMPAAEVDGATMAQWRDKRLKEVAPASVQRELSLVSSVFKRAIREWRLPMAVNPVSTIQQPKKPPHRRRRVSDDERALILKMLAWDGAKPPKDKRQWIAWGFCLALETMMRQGEILNMTWGHVHTEKKFVHLPMTKNGHSRNVPLSAAARSLLDMLPRRDDAAKVVPVDAGTFGAYFREAVREAEIKDLHFHDTRREALTRKAKMLSNVAELARASGHRELRSLMIYYEPDVTEIAEKLDP